MTDFYRQRLLVHLLVIVCFVPVILGAVIGGQESYAGFVTQSFGKNITHFAKERGYPAFREDFRTFVDTFEKHYETHDEQEYRATKFLWNLNFIERQNAYYESRRIPYRLRINQFADQDMNEASVRKQKTFVSTSARVDAQQQHQQQSSTIEAASSDLGKLSFATSAETDQTGDFDWRNKGVVSRVKNQGNCGSCWILASLSVVESVNALANNTLTELSTQQLMDCVRPPAFVSRGCDGGSPLEAFDFVQRFGVASSVKYGGSSRRGRETPSGCRDVSLPSDKQWIDFYRLSRSLTDQQMMRLVRGAGPIAALINAGDEDFTYYGDGVLTSQGDTRFDTPFNHLIVIVGYGNDNGLDYWLVRNSWGTRWGNEGYAKLLRGINNRGINNFVIYAGATHKDYSDNSNNKNGNSQPFQAPASSTSSLHPATLLIAYLFAPIVFTFLCK